MVPKLDGQIWKTHMKKAYRGVVLTMWCSWADMYGKSVRSEQCG